MQTKQEKKGTSRMRRRVNFVGASFMWVRNIKQEVSYKQIDCNTPIWIFVCPPYTTHKLQIEMQAIWTSFYATSLDLRHFLFHTTSLKLHKLGHKLHDVDVFFTIVIWIAQLVKVARLLHNIRALYLATFIISAAIKWFSSNANVFQN